MSIRTQDHIELELERGFAGGERSEPEGRAQRTAGGAPAAGGPRTRAARELSEELVEDALERVRAGLPVGELPEEVRERLTDGLIDELLGGARGEKEVLGPGGVLGDLTRRLVERAMEAELTGHLGYRAWPGAAGRGGQLAQRRAAQDAVDRSRPGADRAAA